MNQSPKHADQASTGEVTRWLALAYRGDSNAQQQVLTAITSRIRAVSMSAAQSVPGGVTNNPTELLSLAYTSLFSAVWEIPANRDKFLERLYNCVRNALIDRWRVEHAQKRQPPAGIEPLDARLPPPSPGQTPDCIVADREAVAKAVDSLEAANAEAFACLILKYDRQLTVQQIAAVINTEVWKVKDYLSAARAWLAARLLKEA